MKYIFLVVVTDVDGNFYRAFYDANKAREYVQELKEQNGWDDASEWTDIIDLAVE